MQPQVQKPHPRTPSQSSSQTPNRVTATSTVSASGTAGNAALAAALKGATLAFQAAESAQKSTTTTTSENKPDSSPAWPLRPQSQAGNGAVRAATQAAAARDHSLSRPRSPANRQSVSHQGTGGSAQELGTYSRGRDMDRDSDQHGLARKASQQLSPFSAGNSPSLLRPGTDGKQASFIAATLAASRSASPSPNHTGQTTSFAQSPLTPTQLHSRITRRESVGGGADSFFGLSSPGDEVVPPPPLTTDTSSVRPANSLISLFEYKKDDMDPVKRREPSPRQQQRARVYPRVQPPTPPRSRSPDVESTTSSRRSAAPPKRPKLKPKPASLLEKPAPGTAESVGTAQADDQSKGCVRTKGLPAPPQAPTQRRKSRMEDGSNAGPREERKKKPSPPRQDYRNIEVASPSALPPAKPLSKPSPPPAKRLSEPALVVPTPRPISRGTEFASPQPKRALQPPPPFEPLPRSTKGPKQAIMMSQKVPSHTETPWDTERDLSTDSTAPRQAEAEARRLSQVSASSDDSFVSASSTQSPRAMSPVKGLERNLGGRDSSASSSSTLRLPILPPRQPPYQGRPSPPLRTTISRATTSNNSTPTLPLDSLTNAILAGSLASARLSTASLSTTQSGPSPPLPPPRRHGTTTTTHHRSHNPLHMLHPQHTADSSTGNKSPASHQHPQRSGGMLRETLRAPPRSLSDDEDARRHSHKHRKKALSGKKHAHHEGSRRRWRDEISPRERRRYEAVWASNRGLFLRRRFAFEHPDNYRRASSPSLSSSPSARDRDRRVEGEEAMAAQVDLSRARDDEEERADCVVNVVARDIWSRSRLPADELAEVWDLVDRRRRGMLGKQEFVVGMWLVDQRLRGRKIPARVSESVWESARGGMKILTPALSGGGGGKRKGGR